MLCRHTGRRLERRERNNPHYMYTKYLYFSQSLQRVTWIYHCRIKEIGQNHAKPFLTQIKLNHKKTMLPTDPTLIIYKRYCYIYVWLNLMVYEAEMIICGRTDHILLQSALFHSLKCAHWSTISLNRKMHGRSFLFLWQNLNHN